MDGVSTGKNRKFSAGTMGRKDSKKNMRISYIGMSAQHLNSDRDQMSDDFERETEEY